MSCSLLLVSLVAFLALLCTVGSATTTTATLYNYLGAPSAGAGNFIALAGDGDLLVFGDETAPAFIMNLAPGNTFSSVQLTPSLSTVYFGYSVTVSGSLVAILGAVSPSNSFVQLCTYQPSSGTCLPYATIEGVSLDVTVSLSDGVLLLNSITGLTYSLYNCKTPACTLITDSIIPGVASTPTVGSQALYKGLGAVAVFDYTNLISTVHFGRYNQLGWTEIGTFPLGPNVNALASNGNLIAVGSPYLGTAAGIVLVFSCSSGTCELVSTLVGENYQDQFGSSLAFYETNLAVGAPGVNGSTGVVYLFDCSSFPCVPSATVLPIFPGGIAPVSAGVPGDLFGSKVTFAGGYLIVAASGFPGGAGNGGAFLFQVTLPSPSTCPSSAFDHATYGPTTIGQAALGLCDTGYVSVSSPTRKCLAAGLWSGTVSNRCQSKQLPSFHPHLHASWQAADPKEPKKQN